MSTTRIPHRNRTCTRASRPKSSTQSSKAGNWRMPWHTSGRFAFSPINAVTHKPYRGVNVLALVGRGAIQGL
jgi:hypothetical protein